MQLSSAISGDYKYEFPQPTGGHISHFVIKADQNGAEIDDVMLYDKRSNTVTVFRHDATFRISQRRRGWKRLFGEWEVIADIKNGKGFVQGNLVFRITNTHLGA